MGQFQAQSFEAQQTTLVVCFFVKTEINEIVLWGCQCHHPLNGNVKFLIPSSSQNPNMDDDFLKRNTDCVYFLASPLTCKKVLLFLPFPSFNSFARRFAMPFHIFFHCCKPSFCCRFQLYSVSVFFTASIKQCSVF